MTLTSLALRDFRNIAAAELRFPADGVAIIGENGHGKTNLLEAIAYLELLRSTRGARDRDLIRFGATGFHIGATMDGASAQACGAGSDRAGRKKVTLDGVENVVPIVVQQCKAQPGNHFLTAVRNAMKAARTKG